MRRRMMGRQISEGLLPTEYQQVEYIRPASDKLNNGYINTNLCADNNTEISLTYKTERTNGLNLAYGNKFGFSSTDVYSYRYGSTSNKHSIASSIINEKVSLSLSSFGLFLNAEKISDVSSPVDFVDDSPLILFGYKALNAVYVFWYYLYGFYAKKNDKFIRNMVPCYRKSDGKIGMYDLCGSICPLTGTPFYVNSGTGTFLKDADV